MICLCPSAPHKMRFFWLTVFLWNLPLSSVHSLSCEMNEYEWPYLENPQWCCSKCKAGQYMTSRCKDSTTDTVCEECSKGMYTEDVNVLSRCKACINCGHNERKISSCTSKQNTVCECKPGYKRRDKNSVCEEERREMMTTATTTNTQPQQPTTTKQLPKPTPSNKSYESVLLPVVLIVCMCILLLIIATKLKKLELFGCCQIDDSTSSKDTQSTEEEPLPIQEVCSHQQEEWRKDGLESIVSMNE